MKLDRSAGPSCNQCNLSPPPPSPPSCATAPQALRLSVPACLRACVRLQKIPYWRKPRADGASKATCRRRHPRSGAGAQVEAGRCLVRIFAGKHSTAQYVAGCSSEECCG